MSRFRSLAFGNLVVIAAVALCRPAQALIIENATGTTAAPVAVGADPGWLTTSLSGSRNYIYLGDGWALTARHVGAPNSSEPVQFFNGSSTVSLNIIPGQNYVVRNPATVQNSMGQTLNLNNVDGQLETDLRLIRLNGDPGFGPTLPFVVAEQPLALNNEVTIIGHGRSKNGGLKSWNSSWQEVPPNPGPVQFTGYAGMEPNDDTKRWGKNNVANATEYHSTNALYEILSNTTGVLKLKTPDQITRNVISFLTTFNQPGAGVPAQEAQATAGDSGSAVFHKRGNQWELAGIVNSTFTFSNQPALTAAYGNVITITDLSYYYNSNPNDDYASSISDIMRTHAIYSLAGDVNLDGAVQGNGSGPVATDDVSAFVAGWGANNGQGVGTINSWKLGDLSGPTGGRDGKTDIYDFLAMRNTLNPVAQATLASMLGISTAVPEPASAVLAIMAFSCLVGIRRRGRR